MELAPRRVLKWNQFFAQSSAEEFCSKLQKVVYRDLLEPLLPRHSKFLILMFHENEDSNHSFGWRYQKINLPERVFRAILGLTMDNGYLTWMLKFKKYILNVRFVWSLNVHFQNCPSPKRPKKKLFISETSKNETSKNEMSKKWNFPKRKVLISQNNHQKQRHRAKRRITH